MSGDEREVARLQRVVESDRRYIERRMTERDQARADLAAARTREAALRDLLAELMRHDFYVGGRWTNGMRTRVVAALDDTDQQPGDAT